MHRLADLVPDGLIARPDLAAATSDSTVKRWLRARDVVELQPGVLVLAERAGDWAIRARAATSWSGGPLSHLSALRALGLVPTAAGPVHVTVPVARLPRGRPGVVVHRSDRRLVTVRRGPLEAVAPERSLVDAWSWAHSCRRNPRATQEAPLVRQALIEAVRSREVSVRAVRRASDQLGAHPGTAGLATLLGLVAGGCQSELEIWGVLLVLPGPPLVPGWVQQHRIVLADGRRLRRMRPTWRRAWPWSWTARPSTAADRPVSVTSAGTARWPPPDGSCCASASSGCCGTRRAAGVRSPRRCSAGWSMNPRGPDPRRFWPSRVHSMAARRRGCG